MLLVVEVVDHLEEILRVKVVTVGRDESEELDLIDTLIEVVLVVLDDFHANHLLSVNVITLDGFRESS
jgi:hypothetical protein